jgi:hypothetical protein
MSGMDGLLGKPGESVPIVDASDLKVMWTYSEEVKAQHPGATSAPVGFSVWKNLCSAGADIAATSFRCGLLMMLQDAWTGGRPSETAFKVAARMDLSWPQVGVVQNAPILPLGRFITEVHLEAIAEKLGWLSDNPIRRISLP